MHASLTVFMILVLFSAALDQAYEIIEAIKTKRDTRRPFFKQREHPVAFWSLVLCRVLVAAVIVVLVADYSLWLSGVTAAPSFWST